MQVWTFDHYSVEEQHGVFERLFSTRRVKVIGHRNRVYYKVLMASNKKGMGIIEYNLKTQMLTIKVAARRFNANGETEGGADITPASELDEIESPTSPNLPRSAV